MGIQTENKSFAQLLADYAEDHARVANAVTMLIHEENPCFLLDFKDKELQGLLESLCKEVKELRMRSKPCE